VVYKETSEYNTLYEDATNAVMSGEMYFDLNALMSNETNINETAENLAWDIGNMLDDVGYWDTLPQVCEAGEECYDEYIPIWIDTVSAEWEIAFTNIQNELQNAILRTEPIIEEGYAEFASCDAGCGPTCEEIYVEYENVVN
jgi:hypothetical protein